MVTEYIGRDALSLFVRTNYEGIIPYNVIRRKDLESYRATTGKTGCITTPEGQMLAYSREMLEYRSGLCRTIEYKSLIESVLALETGWIKYDPETERFNDLIGKLANAFANLKLEQASLEPEAAQEPEPEEKPDYEPYIQGLMSEITELKSELAKAKKAVTFYNAICVSEDAINVGTLATLITQAGFEISQSELFRYLHRIGYLRNSADGYERNIPTTEAITSGYVQIREVMVQGSGSTPHLSFTPKITVAGQNYFINLFTAYLEAGHGRRYKDIEKFLTDQVGGV